MSQLIFPPSFFMPVTAWVTPHRCFAHVVNIANVAVMSKITKVAAIENASTIWEYNLALPGNCVLGGSLDVIASVRTIAIKVNFTPSFYLSISHYTQIQASGQRTEHFKKLQIQCKIMDPLKSPSIAMFDGVQHILCLIAHISYAK